MQQFDFLSFAERCPDFLAVLNNRFEIAEINAQWRSILPDEVDEIQGKNFLNYIFHEDADQLSEMMSSMAVKDFNTGLKVRLLSSRSNFIYAQLDVLRTPNGFQLRARDVSRQTEDSQVVSKAAQLGDLGAWYHDPIEDRSYWDEVIYDIYDLEAGSPIDHETVISYYHPEDKPKMMAAINRLYKKHRRYDQITRIVTAKQKLKWIRVVAEPIVNEGKILRVNGLAQDITDRQELLEKMRESNEQKYLALKGIRSGVFDFDLQTNFIDYSPDFAEMVGGRGHEDIGDFRNLIHPDDKEAALKRFNEGVAAEGHHYNNHFRLRDRSGEYRFYEVHAWRKKDEEGRTIRMVGNLIDVHDRVTAEREKGEYLNQLKAALDNGFIQSVLLDREGKVVMADTLTQKLGALEHGFDPIATKTYFGNLLRPDEKKRFEDQLPKVLEGEQIRKEVQHITMDGTITWLEIVYHPVQSDEGKVTGVVISFMDIGERKFAEIEKRYHDSRLDELNRMKNNIIGNLSHEIRTPLNGIVSVAELLPDIQDPKEMEELLEIQKKSSKRLLETIDGVINLSRLSAEKSNLHFEEVNLAQLIESSIEKLSHNATIKGLKLELLSSPTDVVVYTDKLMLEQSLVNVLNNAVKFTSEGGIEVSHVVEGDYAKILVQDTGIGISLENQDRIFEDFEQESDGHARAYEGAGVGLSFSKKFLDMTGGQIDVVSIKDEGSLFTITLPLLK